MKDAADFRCVCVIVFRFEPQYRSFLLYGLLLLLFPQMKPNDVYFRNIGLLEFYGQPCPRHVLS